MRVARGWRDAWGAVSSCSYRRLQGSRCLSSDVRVPSSSGLGRRDPNFHKDGVPSFRSFVRLLGQQDMNPNDFNGERRREVP